MDLNLLSFVHNPTNYGFIPQSYYEDNDPLNIFVLGQKTEVPHCIMRAKPIGVMKKLDQDEADDKIIAVHVMTQSFQKLIFWMTCPPIELRKFHNIPSVKALETRSKVTLLR